MVGAVIGLVVGLFTYAPTAPFAAVELGLPAIVGGIVGLVAGAVVRVADGRSGTTAHGQDHCELHPRKTLVVINPVHRFWVLGDVCLRGARAGLLFGWGPYLPASVTSVPIEPFRQRTFCAETIASRQNRK